MNSEIRKTAKGIYLALISLTMIFSLGSCEEDVVLDLGKIEKRLVVEAQITNEETTGKVSLSYSQNFYDTPEYALLTNATIVLTSETGEAEQLKPNELGMYETNTLKPVPGMNYKLNISVDGKQVEVSTYLPKKIEITNATFIPNPFFETPDSLNVFVSVADPKGEDNFFRLRVNEAGTVKTTEYYLSDDTFGKDGIISMPIYFKNFSPGDTVVVELYHLTPELFQYYSTLSENLRGSFNSIAPGNPVSNMPDDVYGFFAGYSVDVDTIVVGAMGF